MWSRARPTRYRIHTKKQTAWLNNASTEYIKLCTSIAPEVLKSNNRCRLRGQKATTPFIFLHLLSINTYTHVHLIYFGFSDQFLSVRMLLFPLRFSPVCFCILLSFFAHFSLWFFVIFLVKMS